MLKAAQIVETLDARDAKPYYGKLAKHFEAARAYDEAERFFLRAGLPQDVVEMYSRCDTWERALGRVILLTTHHSLLTMKVQQVGEGLRQGDTAHY